MKFNSVCELANPDRANLLQLSHWCGIHIGWDDDDAASIVHLRAHWKGTRVL